MVGPVYQGPGNGPLCRRCDRRTCIQARRSALVPLIETTAELGLKPKEALADTLYGGDENCRKAEVPGVEIVSPVKGTGPTASSLTEFKPRFRERVEHFELRPDDSTGQA